MKNCWKKCIGNNVDEKNVNKQNDEKKYLKKKGWKKD